MACSLFGNILFYSWTANYTGYIQASTCNSANFNTVVAIYDDCNSFLETYNMCNNDYCEGTSLLNAPVIFGTTYYIAVGGLNDIVTVSGTGTLKLSQSNLTLAIFNSSIPITGGTVEFTIETYAADNFATILQLNCTGESLIEFNTSTSSTSQTFDLGALNEGVCSVVARDGDNPNLVSNTAYLLVGDPIATSIEATIYSTTEEATESSTDTSNYFTCTSDVYSSSELLSSITDDETTATTSEVTTNDGITTITETDIETTDMTTTDSTLETTSDNLANGQFDL